MSPRRIITAGLLALFATDCRPPSNTATHGTTRPPSSVEHPVHEEALPQVRLSPQAIARLRVEQSTVRASSVAATRLVGGEVIVPPGRTLVVTAPVAGEVRLATGAALAPGASVRRGEPLFRLAAFAPTDRDTRARVRRELDAALSNLAALELRVQRNQTLVDQRAGSARSLEEAIAARDVARADVSAARARANTLARAPLLADISMLVRAPGDGVLRSISVSAGQAVAAGAPLFEWVAVDALQVRVAVYSGDLARIAAGAPARVRRQGQQSAVESAPVTGPPTAEVDRATVDRYYALPSDTGFAPGERVLVELAMREVEGATVVPAAAVVLDAWGGAWVYRCEQGRFERARVDPVRRAGDEVVVAHGPAVGSCVVSVGAVELFGAEFPPGH
jgi:RND family efflux transporter MFP subunit